MAEQTHRMGRVSRNVCARESFVIVVQLFASSLSVDRFNKCYRDFSAHFRYSRYMRFIRIYSLEDNRWLDKPVNRKGTGNGVRFFFQ